MAARHREDRVPKLRIPFKLLEKKCSEILLNGFESRPTESDQGCGVPSSSCNETDDGVNLFRDVKPSGADSPKKGGSGGLLQIKPTTLQATRQKPSGARSEARRRRGSENPERKQWFLKDDEAGRFSEPNQIMSRRSSKQGYDNVPHSSGKAAEDAEQKCIAIPKNGKAEKEYGRMRRYTDDGQVSDQSWHPVAPSEERLVGIKDGRRSQSEGRKLSSSVSSEKESALVADWQRYTDGRLQKALSKLNDHPSKLMQILHTCSRLQETGKSLLLTSLDVSARQEVSYKMWKCAHYPVIEVLRNQACETEESAQRDQLESFLKSSTAFYLSLVESMEEKYGFQVPTVLAGQAQFNSKTHLRTVMMALSVCECFYIYLGDLTRYYEQYIQDKPDWSKPRNYYLKAQTLAPKDGKPYNQLAVVALNAHRRLDACYYYMRSLKAKVPFQSAMDRLVGLFEDASRKAKRVEEEEQKMKKKAEREAARKKKKAERLKNKRLKQHDKSKSPFIQQFSSGRREVWIMPGTEMPSKSDPSGHGQGGVASKEPETTVDDYYTSFTHSEILKKLISAFLVTHGKLFTKIGIELFDGSRERLLHLWLIYWTRLSELTASDTSRLLKMTVVNIFSIHNAKEMHTDESSSCYYVDLAFSFALQLNTTLLDACSQITELVPPPPASSGTTTRQQQSADVMNHNESSSSSGHSSIRQAPSTNGVTEPMGELSLEETATISRGDLRQLRGRREESELDLAQLPQGPSPAVSGSPTPSSSCWAPCERASLLTADASAELLYALDLLAIILPSVKVWLDWMRIQKELWMCSAFKNTESFLMNKFLTSSFTFVNKALDLLPVGASQFTNPMGGVPWACDGKVSLWEDRTMAGFMPLKADVSVKDAFSMPELSKLSTQQLREQCVLRMLEMVRLYRNICEIISAVPNGNFSCKFDPNTMKFSLTKKNSPDVTPDVMHVERSPSSLITAANIGGDKVTEESNDHHPHSYDAVTKLNTDKEKGDKELEAVSSDGEDIQEEEEEGEGGYESDTSESSSSSSSSGEDVVVEGYGDSEEEEEEEQLTDEEDEDEALVTAHIRQLKEQRESLAKQLEAHKKAAETAENVLSEAATKKRHEVHIAPRYLVPDTNCYVDLLPSIKRLVDTTNFTIAVPLIVLAELEGLCKGSLEPSVKQSASKTTSGAKAAVEFIQDSFKSKNSYVKALTTQGSLLSSISFRAEVIAGKASNDDHILESCLKLHSKVDKSKDAVDYYSVVLLTDDRNLRVKALANSLPVKDLPDFMKLLTPFSTKS